MTADVTRRDTADDLAHQRDASAGVALRGAELVAVSERFYHGIFLGALSFVALSTATAAAFLPLRASALDGRPPTTTVVAAAGVLLLAGLAIWRARDVYVLLRRRPQLQLVVVLLAAFLISLASPLRNELWWSSCAILMALATIVSLQRALAYCLAALLANLAAHLATGSIHDTTTVGVIGLWVGMPFWVALTAVVPDRMAAHILRMNVTHRRAPPAPRRVQVWTRDVASEEGSATEAPGPAPESAAASHSSDTGDAPPSAGHVSRADRTADLTARQLQVVALLADGLRYRDIAACLSISPGQVHRHVANAIRRIGVQTASELVALAVAEGLVAGRTQPGTDAMDRGSS